MKLDGRILKEILPLSDLYDIYYDHERLHVFVQKGRECINCDREGVLLLITQDEKGGREHVDLYSRDFVLMTVDHTIPSSKGGADTTDNKQPMCGPCNWEKSDKILDKPQEKRVSHFRTGPEIIRTLVDNSAIFDKTINKGLIIKT